MEKYSTMWKKSFNVIPDSKGGHSLVLSYDNGCEIF